VIRELAQVQLDVGGDGQAGADVVQKVRHVGRDCGTILWECKRAANWSGTWVGKLASDSRKAGAACGVIVSETLPPGMEGSGRVDDVWVCDFGSAAHLAAGLRWVLIAASQYEAANAARADTSGKVYDYIATGGFASRCEAINQTVETMMRILGREKRYYGQKWKEWSATSRPSAEASSGSLPTWSGLAPRFLRRCAPSFRTLPARHCPPVHPAREAAAGSVVAVAVL